MSPLDALFTALAFTLVLALPFMAGSPPVAVYGATVHPFIAYWIAVKYYRGITGPK
jgi:hypothetical protein